MAFKKVSGSVSSLSALFTQVRNFFTGTLGWTQVHSGTQMGSAYYFYHSTGEAGNKDIYIGVRSFERSTLLCGLQFAACTGINTSEDFDSQPGGFGDSFCCCCCQITYYPLLSAVNDGTSMAYWFIGDKDFAHFMLRIGAKYLSAYVGLFNSYWSNYPLPLIVVGSSPGASYMAWDCNCCCWCGRQNAIPYRIDVYDHPGYGASGSSQNWLRNCDNTCWCRCYTGNYVNTCGTLHYLCHDNLTNTDSQWWFITNFYCHSSSSRSQGHVLFPIYVGSPEVSLLGELKYVYYSYFYDDVPSESTIYVGGDPYLVFVSTLGGRNVSIAIRDYE